VEKAKSELKIEFLELNWEDTESWIITDESLRECVLFIDTGLKSGGSVLVHCAQVADIQCIQTISVSLQIKQYI
jgi:hypothetical protein